MKQQNTNLGTEKIGSLLFKLSMPAIIAQMINLLYNLVDRIYIGRIPGVGGDALTGVGVTAPLLMIISAFAALIGSGGAPNAAISMGKGDNKTAEKILGNSVSMIVIISIFITLFVSIYKESILTAFGASAQTMSYASAYIGVYVLGTIFVQCGLGLNIFITAQGFAKVSMKTVLIGAITNIILDPIFIFVFKMGVTGAALATVISQGISAFWVLYFLTGNQTVLKIKLENLKPNFRIIGKTLALGVSPFIMQSTESLIAITYNTSLLRYAGDTAVGAMTILLSSMQFCLLPLMGLSQGMQPIISFNYGARNAKRIKQTFKSTLVIAMGYTTTLCLFLMFFPSFFAKLFTNEQAIIEYVTWSLRIFMSASFLMGAQLVCQQTFISLGNATSSLFLALLRKIFLLLPFILIFPHFFSDKALGVIVAQPSADVIAVATTIILFHFQFNKAMKEIESPLTSKA